MSENSEKDKKIPIECNMPFAGDGEHMYGEHIFQDVRTGSIVQNPLEIRLNEPTTFYLFRVEVGWSLVMRRSTLLSEEYRNNPRSALHPEYDSIYI